jgi:O-antigen ligase
LLLAAGLLGFWLKYEDYLTKGATSAMARSDYWRAAIQTTLENPALGSGPGTFSITYARNKRPEAEMSRLAHNDYLQQASDSGIPAALLYAAVFIVPLVWIQRRIAKDPLLFLTSLGLIAWALHGLFEFGLYIPALSWTAFALLGYACQRASIGLDTPRHAR